MSNHHVVLFKYLSILFADYAPIKLIGGKWKNNSKSFQRKTDPCVSLPVHVGVHWV